jgi:hypothetical protein
VVTHGVTLRWTQGADLRGDRAIGPENERSGPQPATRSGGFTGDADGLITNEQFPQAKFAQSATVPVS